VTVAHGRITRIHRDIPVEQADGEYIGVAKFSAAGAALLRRHYHRCRQRHAGRPFREAPAFEKAYLIHLFQDMLEHGVEMYKVDTYGDYHEIDTTEDYEIALEEWR
jgi:choline kinase